MSTALLAAHQVSKKFGVFTAVDAVSLSLHAGEIHALLGENGAGKSTLVKMFYGSLQPTAGEILWRGAPLRVDNPAQARALGIAMVFQHFSLFEALTVAENIALALPPGPSLADLSARIEALSQDYGLPLTANQVVADLSVGERQRVEIIRCLLQEPAVLIMDEPTAVLTPQEADQLFDTLRRLAAEGCAILYISHRLAEVRALCHHATILRHGRVVADLDPAAETADSLAELMVGTSILAQDKSMSSTATDGPAVLAVRDLSVPADGPFGVALQHIDLTVKAGEIVAIAGIAGNGQSELFNTLSGECLSTPGAVTIDGQVCGDWPVSRRRALGAAFVPEERLGHGAVPDLPLSENVILTRHASDRDLARGGFVNSRAAAALARRVAAAFDVRKSRPAPAARALSGGNLQKFVIGRELDRAPRLLIVNQPTWGVDAGAAAVIRQALIALAADGAAVLMISQDLDEIFAVADRVAVIARGRLAPARPVADISRRDIGLLMAGLPAQAAS